MDINKPLPIVCDCATDGIQVNIFFEDEDPEWRKAYFTFTSLYPGKTPLRQRLRAIWTILKGDEYHLGEVIMDAEDAERLASHINAHVERAKQEGRW